MSHTHVIGGTGKGKSKILELLLRHDIQERDCGACLIDPHGTLNDEILHDVSNRYPHLAERFVLFDPARHADVVLGFNPIPKDAKDNCDYVIGTLVAACLKSWGQDNMDRTPRITRWLENVFQTVIDNDLTLAEALPLLSTTDRFSRERRELVKQVQNEAVVEDWEMLARSNNLQRQNTLEGAINRLRKFLRSAPIRNALGQQHHVLDLPSIMAEGKILLVNLNGYNTISSDNTKLLGTMLVNELFRVAKLRDDRDPNLRPFFLYIDEFAQYCTRDIARALDECRKFKMFLVLAHQHLAQLREEDEYLYASVMTNCHNRIVFGGLSKEDAELMADEIATGFVDLRHVKDEMWTTKVRHEEETRTTAGRTYGASTGHSDSRAESQSAGVTRGQSRSRSQGTTTTDTVSHSVGHSEGHSDAVTVTDGRTETTGRTVGHSRSQGTTEGTSTGTSTTEGRSWQTSQTKTTGGSSSRHHGRSGSTSRQEGWSSSESSGESEASGSSSGQTESRTDNVRPGERMMDQTGSTSHGQQDGHSRSSSANQSSSEGQSGSTTESEGWNDGRSEGTSFSDGVTDGESDSLSDARSQSVSASRSRSTTDSNSRSTSEARSHSTGRSRTDSVSRSQTEGWSHGDGRSSTESTGQSESRSRSESTARTKTNTTSRSESRTETVVPFLRPVQYKELTSRTFYTLAEMQYLVMAAIKNQGVGQAFIKTKTGEPRHTMIRRVRSTPFHPILSRKRVAAFRARVIAAHPQLYLTADEAYRQQNERQVRVFREPLVFERGRHVIEIEAHTVVTDDGGDDDGSPFA